MFFVRRGKPIPKGLNIIVLCDKDTGYPITFEVQDKAVWRAAGVTTTSIVLDMAKELRTKHHHIYFDNVSSVQRCSVLKCCSHHRSLLCGVCGSQLYTSPRLAVDLLRMGHYSCGTSRPARAGFPKQVVLSKRGPRSRYKRAQNGRLTVYCERDSGVVSFTSTIHALDRGGRIQRYNKKKRKFTHRAVSKHQQDYNKGKDPVDNFNRKLVSAGS